MKSLHIQSDNNKLYSVIHRPSENSKTIRKHAVVLCSPITHEHDTSYMALRQLALRLSKLGFDVARFDYYATGNSNGTSQQISLQTCARNILDVGQYLSTTANSEKLTYIGLRLGAILASMSAVNQPPDQLILWDPVISGNTITPELASMHKRYLEKVNRTEAHQHTLGREYLGYPYSDNILNELNNTQLADIKLPDTTSISIISSPDNTEQNQFVEKVRNNGIHLQHEIIAEDSIDWQNIRILDEAILPGQSINQICNILKAS